MPTEQGPYTGCALGDVTPLFTPWRDVNHQLMPVFSQGAAALSLELAAAAYDMQTAPWRSAGWRDISYLIDDTLLTGPAVNGETSIGEFSSALAERYQRQAASLVRKQNPISLVRGALRQREASDTCKCLVMCLKTGPIHTVAIGFMGTGKRVYDWFSNFRTDREEGMHRGFLQLTEEFEANCPLIEFPETARDMGLEKLSLSDIFQACRRPGSRFRIWMAGHSQGGAVMQLAAFREIRRGLLKQNLIGYGFASPSVAYENPGCDLAGVPLFHFINSDDVTPRVGAYLHIGRCMIFKPDAPMRRRCYAKAWDDPAFRAALTLLQNVHGSKTGLTFSLALFRAIESLSDQEAAAAMGKMLGSFLPERMLSALGSRSDQLLRFMMRRAEIAYARATAGEEMPPGLLEQDQKKIAALLRAYGAQKFIRALFQALALPHRLRTKEGEEKGDAPYQLLVNSRFSLLRSYPNSGNVPRITGQPLRAQKAPPGGRFRRGSLRRNQRTIR